METSKTIKLIIPGEPKAQERHRSVIMPRKKAVVLEARNKTTGKTERFYRKKDLFMHNYDPSYRVKRDISRIIGALAPVPPWRGPIRVDRYYYFPYLRGHYGTGRNAGNVKVTAPIWKGTRPDVDNFDKLLFDVISGLFIKDDGQIAAGIQIKQYSEVPRTEVYISKLTIESDIEELEDELHIQANRQLAQTKKQETQELAFSSHLPTNS